MKAPTTALQTAATASRRIPPSGFGEADGGFSGREHSSEGSFSVESASQRE
ncbi:hypothetical protein IWX75_001006 [Arthrobacter sp. CAN_A6]